MLPEFDTEFTEPEYEPLTHAISSSRTGALVVKYVQPHYDKIVAGNPEHNLPKSPETALEAVEIPESEEVLGPIIDAGDVPASGE